MFSMCSELTPRAHVPDNRIPQLMQPSQSRKKLGLFRLGLETLDFDLKHSCFQLLFLADWWSGSTVSYYCDKEVS